MRPACHTTRFSFGWSKTRRAGGRGGGEIGGLLSRSSSVLAKYGTPSSGSFDTPLSATGLIRVPDVTGGGAQFGWYSEEGSTEWRTSNTLTLRVSGDTLGWRLYPDATSTDYLAASAGAMPSDARFSYAKSYRWTVNYTPATSQVTTQVQEVGGPSLWTSTYTIPAELRADGAAFDRFGILSQQVELAAPMRLFLDDVTVNGTTYTFDSDPGWQGSNNSYKAKDCSVHGRQDFGAEQLGIGGTIWRGAKGWFADVTAVPLDGDDVLYAEGSLQLSQATSDADVYLGWFDADSTWTAGPPAVVTNDAVYASVGAPSRVGFRFTPVFRSSTGQSARYAFSGPDQFRQPLLNARGSSRRFSICYRPRGDGSATLTATLGADAAFGIPRARSVVQVPASVRSTGLSVDHFGLFAGQDGGHSVGLRVDDLQYTTRPGDACH